MRKRFFLNEDTGSTAVMAVKTDEVAGKTYLDAEVILHDCTRQVAIDFGCNKAGRGERLRKVRKMIAALQEVEVFIAEYKFGNRTRFD